MDLILLLKAAIMGLVEGATEFLPVSSTGHLILTGDILNFMTPEKREVFEIAIQLGAILAVVWEYRARFVSTFAGLGKNPVSTRLFTNIAIAFLPLALIGFLFGSKIKEHLFNPVTVAIAFIVGGFIILLAEKQKHTVTVATIDDVTPMDALKLGLAQTLALIPGTSRSGATIIGGLFFGLSRKAAAEFSFFLAVPTLGMATLYSLYKARHLLEMADLGAWIVGFMVAFISAMIAIRALIRYVSNHDFTIFAWYRIVFGLVLLGFYLLPKYIA